MTTDERGNLPLTPGWKLMALVGAFYLGALAVATWPAFASMGTTLPSRVDPLAHIWTMRWNKDCLLHGRLPFVAPGIQYPVGASLGTLPPMHFQTLLYVPLSMAIGNDVLCYKPDPHLRLPPDGPGDVRPDLERPPEPDGGHPGGPDGDARRADDVLLARRAGADHGRLVPGLPDRLDPVGRPAEPEGAGGGGRALWPGGDERTVLRDLRDLPRLAVRGLAGDRAGTIGGRPLVPGPARMVRGLRGPDLAGDGRPVLESDLGPDARVLDGPSRRRVLDLPGPALGVSGPVAEPPPEPGPAVRYQRPGRFRLDPVVPGRGHDRPDRLRRDLPGPVRPPGVLVGGVSGSSWSSRWGPT